MVKLTFVLRLTTVAEISFKTPQFTLYKNTFLRSMAILFELEPSNTLEENTQYIDLYNASPKENLDTALNIPKSL